MPFLTLIALPNVSDIYTGISAVSSPTFDQYVPWVLLGTGVIVGAMLAILLFNVLHKAVKHFADKLSLKNFDDNMY